MARRPKRERVAAEISPPPSHAVEAAEIIPQPAQEPEPVAEPVAPAFGPLAVCLITCERPEYTRRVVEAFVSLNADAIVDGRLVLLHADDASQNPAVMEAVAAAGFETVARHMRRVGAQATRRLVVRAAQDRGLVYTLLLENDWEMCRPLPWAAIEYFAQREDCWQLRLFGRLREREGDGWPCLTQHYGKRMKDAGWTAVEGAPEPMEIGDIHACTTTCVTRTDLLLDLLNKSPSASKMMADCARVPGMVLRTVENVGWHIGKIPPGQLHGTPDFIP